MECLVCGTIGSQVVFNDRGFEVVECPSCHFGIVSPLPDIPTLAAMYDSAEYFSSHMHYNYAAMDSDQIKMQVAAAGKLHQGILGGLATNVQSVLEIGPGGGFALKHFEQQGKQVLAVETSAASSQFMRQRLGLAVENAMLETFQTTETWDLVMLNHVLEHFLDLRAAMAKLSSLVATGGLLYIRVPNHNSYDRRQMGNAWPAYLPFHISYFSEQSLRLLLQQSGFQLVHTSSFISENFLKGAPKFVRQLGIRILKAMGKADSYQGRTVAIVGRKIAT